MKYVKLTKLEAEHIVDVLQDLLNNENFDVTTEYGECIEESIEIIDSLCRACEEEIP